MCCPFSDTNLDQRLCENYSRQVQKSLDKLKMGGHQDAMVQHLTVQVCKTFTYQNSSSSVMLKTDTFSGEVSVLHMH